MFAGSAESDIRAVWADAATVHVTVTDATTNLSGSRVYWACRKRAVEATMLMCTDTRTIYAPSMLGAIVQALAMLAFVAAPEAVAFTLTQSIAFTMARASGRATPEEAIRTLPSRFTLAFAIRRVAFPVATTLFVAVFDARAHRVLALLAIHQRVTYTAAFGDANALPTARARDASLDVLRGVAVWPVRETGHAWNKFLRIMLVVADAVGSEPALVTDAFVVAAMSVSKTFLVALLPLCAVGHRVSERTVTPAFAVAAAATQFTETVAGTAIVRTVDACVSAEALASQVCGVGRPTDAMSRACPGARAHTARIPGPSRFAQTVRWENICVKVVFPIIQWINRCYATAMSRASSRTNRDATIDTSKIRLALATAKFALSAVGASVGA